MRTPAKSSVVAYILALAMLALSGPSAMAEKSTSSKAAVTTKSETTPAPAAVSQKSPVSPKKTAASANSPATVSVRNVELIHEKGGVRVRVHLTGATDFTHQIEPAKGGKPYRIILDCINAVHRLGANRFMVLPRSVISSIRSSQYTVRPQRICRIVLDLEKEAFYRVQAGKRHIDLFVTDVTARPFGSWSVASFLANRNAAAERKKVADKATPKTLSAAGPVKTRSTKSVAKKPAVRKPVAGKKPVTVAKKSESPAVRSSTPAKGTKTKTARSKASAKTDVKKRIPKVTPKPATPKKKTAVLASAKKTAKKTTRKSNKAAGNTSVRKSRATVASNKKINNPAKSGKNSTDRKTRKKAPKTKKPALASSAAGKTVATKVDKRSNDKKTRRSKKAKQPKSSSSLFGATAQAATKPKASSSPASDRGYSAKFRRSVDKLTVKLKGTRVAEFPKRLVIKYKSRGTRDPFGSLFASETDSKSSVNARPNVESLTMVGVLRNVDGKTRGLFEDIHGRGYILAKGDRVEHGTVLKVTTKKAYFQVFEYGWSRTVALSLEG